MSRSRRAATRLARGLRRHPLATDVVTAASLLVLGVASERLYRRALGPGDLPGEGLSIALTVALHAPLAVRRRWPLAVLATVTAMFGWYRMAEVPEPTISSVTLFIALVAAGMDARRWRTASRAVAVLAMLGVLGVSLLVEDVPATQQGLWYQQVALTLGFNGFFFAAAWMLGDAFHTRTMRERLLEERTAALEVEREVNAQRAVVAERLRIAREIHDVVAHHVSVMGVQAAAARRVMDRRPEAAAAALADVESSSRQAIDELRRLLGFLRQDERPADVDRPADDLAPQPSLRDLDALVAEARASGMDVTATVEGDLDDVTGSVDVSAYRIVQEALTNTRKHAGTGASVRVEVACTPGRLAIAVVDDGRRGREGRGGRTAGAGLGLVGMRERAALHGGHVATGPEPGGGFAVRVTFPLDRRAVA